jgi:hypothetical protein
LSGINNDAFFILSDCVNTKNHILVKDRVYEIVDFLKNAETKITHIKFKEAYVRGFEVYVVGIEITKGDLIYCHHRLNSGILNCDWMIVDLDLFEKTDNEVLTRF